VGLSEQDCIKRLLASEEAPSFELLTFKCKGSLPNLQESSTLGTMGGRPSEHYRMLEFLHLTVKFKRVVYLGTKNKRHIDAIINSHVRDHCAILSFYLSLSECSTA
jgi:hypothetical protein